MKGRIPGGFPGARRIFDAGPSGVLSKPVDVVGPLSETLDQAGPGARKREPGKGFPLQGPHDEDKIDLDYNLGAKRFFQESTEDLLVHDLNLRSVHWLTDFLSLSAERIEVRGHPSRQGHT